MRIVVSLLLAGLILVPSAACPSEEAGDDPTRDFAAARLLFNQTCSGCHGTDGGGGDHAPALVNNIDLRTLTLSQIQNIIKDGKPSGMPAFALQGPDLARLARWLRSQNKVAIEEKPPGDSIAGRRFFFGNGKCAECHMVYGTGSTNGPDLSAVALRSTVRELGLVLDDPTSHMGARSTPTCPSWAFCPDVRWAVVDVDLRNGTSLRGFARNEAEHDVQLQTFDGLMRFLTDADFTHITHETQSYMPTLKATSEERRDLIAYLSRLGGVPLGARTSLKDSITPTDILTIEHPRAGEWPTYNGLLGGNRHSALRQVNVKSVAQLQLQWTYSLGGTNLETTPIVSDGVMYVTANALVCALDARTGRSIWCSPRSSPTRSPVESAGDDDTVRNVDEHAATETHAAQGDVSPTEGPNRGVALLGDRIFFNTDDAHIVCLNRVTGGVLWDVPMSDPSAPGHYGATSAPLVVGDLVVSGVSGGDLPLRGFVAAYKATTGELVWRFWTIPKPGELAADTWQGQALPTGGGAPWLTGSYDPALGLIYWAVGNPNPDTNGAERLGANLYTNSVVALDAQTGSLRWYYQFTPHDVHDWDATEPLLLIDTRYLGRQRKLLLQANRNGFFYALDRTNGELLFAAPFVKKLTWASAIGSDGSPILLPGNEPTSAGTTTCPCVRGATSWYASAFNPETRLFYVMAVEDCSIYKTHLNVFAGHRDTSNPGKRYLRALNIETAATAWEIPLAGTPEDNYSGVLSTAGGLVFHGEDGGTFAAVDAKTGKTLWKFRANVSWRAAPMTYAIHGRQYVAIAAGNSILSFALGQAN